VTAPRSARRFSALVVLCAGALAGVPGAQGAVLSEQKISETAGGFGGVLDSNDQFGRCVVSLGDLDGDGIGDLAVGVPGDDDGSLNMGAVWILFLNADGTVASEQKISDTEGDFTGVLDPYDFFGSSIVLVGDLDGFGNPELAIGAPHDDDGRIDAGAVWIVSLWFDGTVFNARKLSATQGAFAHNLDMSDYFGHSVAAPGDVNGDGIPDLAVGAIYDDDGGNNQGAVWMLLLAWNGSVQSVVKISETSGGFGGVLDVNDSFGASVAGLGDLDGDGVGDLAVGAVLDDDGGSEQGAVWILFLEGRDEMPPVVTCPADMDVEATSPAGAIVAFSVTVSDDRDPMPSLACTPPSGSLFPFGPTTVTCIANDATGNTTKSAFIVTVADTTPPVPACPADVTLECTGPAGEVVVYSPTASDLCDPSPAVVSVPPSGSTFTLGTTTVTTTVTDAAGNSAQCTFDVVVADTTAPTLAYPAVVAVVDAKGGPPGDLAFFAVTSDDLCDLAPAVSCLPPSGSFFPRGVTMVTCTATDASGNQTVGTFPVIVLPSLRAGSL
jgi:hypothetical protein